MNGSGIDYSRFGVRGDPTLATVEKGEAAMVAMVFDLIESLPALYPGIR